MQESTCMHDDEIVAYGTSSDSDFSDLGDDYEDWSGDFTKRLNAARANYQQPNKQTANGGSQAAKAAIRCQQMRSGEALIQSHLDNAGNAKTKTNNRDRSDRATSEQVLDPRTRMMLFKMIQRNVFVKLEGCISTGKEANVYHAVMADDSSLAVKVYKTSILTFKDRDRYVNGEFRYRNGYCRHNPRKMVSTWAEKEMRNLQRMHQAGLSVPKVFLLKSHILVMEFVGRDGWPAPLLKNATNLDAELADRLYVECVWMMRKLYQTCRLVHADLSEYNMLLLDEKLIVIDVSQSVEHDHPHSLEFLRSDISNVTKFFKSYGAAVLGMHKLFELIVNCECDTEVQRLINNERTTEELPNDALFMSAYIPHKLDHVVDYELENEREKFGEEVHNPAALTIAKIVAASGDGDRRTKAQLNKIERKIRFMDLPDEEGDNDEEYDNDSAVNGSDDDEFCSSDNSSESFLEDVSDNDLMDDMEKDAKKLANKTQHQRYVRVRGETADEKRLRKQTVKEDKRKKREVKVPKKVKKRKEKINHKR